MVFSPALLDALIEALGAQQSLLDNAVASELVTDYWAGDFGIGTIDWRTIDWTDAEAVAANQNLVTGINAGNISSNQNNPVQNILTVLTSENISTTYVYVDGQLVPIVSGEIIWDEVTIRKINVVKVLQQTEAGIDINEQNFPDANFRAYLLSQPYGSDSKITDAEIAAITSIDVFQKNISNLTGIHFFTALKELNCHGNNLTALDVSANTALELLDFGENGISTIDLSANTALEVLSCDDNELLLLDLSENSALVHLGCHNNNLTALNLSANTALEFLACSNNNLSALALTALTALETFYGENQTFTLTLTGSESNYTFAIELNNPTFTENAISYNSGVLKSTDKTADETDFTVQTGKAGMELSGTISFTYTETTGISKIESVSVKIYPNPVKNELKIESSELTINKVKIVDLSGKTIYQFNNFRNQIDVSALARGIYFMKLETEKGAVTEKFIKE
jgi:hypothetical protein